MESGAAFYEAPGNTAGREGAEREIAAGIRLRCSAKPPQGARLRIRGDLNQGSSC